MMDDSGFVLPVVACVTCLRVWLLRCTGCECACAGACACAWRLRCCHVRREGRIYWATVWCDAVTLLLATRQIIVTLLDVCLLADNSQPEEWGISN